MITPEKNQPTITLLLRDYEHLLECLVAQKRLPRNPKKMTAEEYKAQQVIDRAWVRGTELLEEAKR